MKVKVIKTFWDKHTGEKHRKGDEIEVTEERFAEIIKKGSFVEKIEKKEPVRKKKTAKKSEESSE